MKLPCNCLISVCLLATCVWIKSSTAYPSYLGCPELTESDFRQEILVSKATNDPSLNEPLEMDFDMDADMNVDIYFVERYGKLKKYDAKTAEITTLASFNVTTGNEQGLVGIALDPDFKNNGHIFVFYTPAETSTFRLSRLTFQGISIDPGT